MLVVTDTADIAVDAAEAAESGLVRVPAFPTNATGALDANATPRRGCPGEDEEIEMETDEDERQKS